MVEFSERLKKYREKLKDQDKKWTQKYVADKIGVARVTYTAYENGTKMPPSDTINRIAELFDVTTDYMMGRTDIPDPAKANIVSESLSYYKNKISKEFPDIDLMFKDMESLTADEMKEVYEYIKFKKSQRDD